MTPEDPEDPEEQEDLKITEFSVFFRTGYPKVVAALRHMGFGLEEAADSAAEAMIQLMTTCNLINNPWLGSLTTPNIIDLGIG